MSEPTIMSRHRAGVVRRIARCHAVRRIAALAHAAGELLPTMDKMAIELRCSRGSIQRAIAVLIKVGALTYKKEIVLTEGWRNVPGRSRPTAVLLPMTRHRVTHMAPMPGQDIAS